MSEAKQPHSPGLAYRLLSLPLILFWLLHGLKHGFKHGKPEYLSTRLFGFESDPDPVQVWVHASSVGEVQAITPLVLALLERGEPILFTSFTATGYHRIRQNFSQRVSAGVIPIDFWWICRRFFNSHKIKLGLIMETELWPELLYQASKYKLPLLQVNARLSAKSSESGPFVRRLLRSTLDYFSQILTRSAEDRDVLLKLGAVEDRIIVLGNLKSVTVDTRQWGKLIDREYILLASSHAGEEQQFLASRPNGLNSCLLVIAPRHPDRSASIQAEIEQFDLPYAVRSRSETINADTAVYLADTLGEMKSLMAHARLVIMGGSFNQSGGHNLLEPASLGCASITGPSDSNIRADIKLLGGGVRQVGDMVQCWQLITELLNDPAQADRIGQTARERLSQQPNIVEKYLAAIEPWL